MAASITDLVALTAFHGADIFTLKLYQLPNTRPVIRRKKCETMLLHGAAASESELDVSLNFQTRRRWAMILTRLLLPNG